MVVSIACVAGARGEAELEKELLYTFQHNCYIAYKLSETKSMLKMCYLANPKILTTVILECLKRLIAVRLRKCDDRDAEFQPMLRHAIYG